MNRVITTFAVLISISRLVFGGESSLTTTYQPLDVLGSGEITITPVSCHDWYSHSGQPTSIGLISAPNVPPTNNPKEATQNLNLASLCGISFSCGDIETSSELTLDATAFAVAKESGYPRENIVRASLECLRRCLPDNLMDAPLILKANEADQAWLSEIIREFNTHDRRKVFYTSPS